MWRTCPLHDASQSLISVTLLLGKIWPNRFGSLQTGKFCGNSLKAHRKTAFFFELSLFNSAKNKSVWHRTGQYEWETILSPPFLKKVCFKLFSSSQPLTSFTFAPSSHPPFNVVTSFNLSCPPVIYSIMLATYYCYGTYFVVKSNNLPQCSLMCWQGFQRNALSMRLRSHVLTPHCLFSR